MEEVDLDRLANHRGNGADFAVRRNELQEALKRALESLSEEQRLTLRLRFEDEAPVSDIARVLGVPSVFHVYRRINKTLAHLRSELKSHGMDGPTP